MKRSLNVLAVALTLFSAFSASAAFAQDPPETPEQANIRVRIPGVSDGRNFKAPLAGGTATVRGRVISLEGDDTTLVSMRFDYRSGADIALDEIIDRILVTVEDQQGTELGRSVIDPNDIHLNPNRSPLLFSTTLYRPQDTRLGSYIVRIRVYGNYE